jgi:hypothetical protein
MKRIFLAIVVGLAFLASCTGVKTSSRGLDNEAFIQVVGNPDNYSGGVDVNIDDKVFFKAEVVAPNQETPKGKVYAISTGNHVIAVSYNNKLLYKKNIFISNQETKRIEL